MPLQTCTGTRTAVLDFRLKGEPPRLAGPYMAVPPFLHGLRGPIWLYLQGLWGHTWPGLSRAELSFAVVCCAIRAQIDATQTPDDVFKSYSDAFTRFIHVSLHLILPTQFEWFAPS